MKTVIQQEIERQKQEMAANNLAAKFNDDNLLLEQKYKEMANANWITIQVLESLLEPEKEQRIKDVYLGLTLTRTADTNIGLRRQASLVVNGQQFKPE